MVKLASARELRMYGPRVARKRFEYVNAALYLFGTLVFVSGFAALFSWEPRSGLVLLLLALGLFIVVHLHDLFAHLAGIDFMFRLMGYDLQLGLVEFGVPVMQFLGSLLFFLAILFLLIQEVKGPGYFKFERHALNMLIAAPILWLLGSIDNSCQIYERADGHVQILQQSVEIPFLMGSTMFLVAAVLNTFEQAGVVHHGLELLGRRWRWMGIVGGLVFLVGGLTNVIRVFKMHQMDGVRLEKLRGGAQERWMEEREGQVPFVLDQQRRR